MDSTQVMGRGGRCPAYLQPRGLRGQWEGCVGSALLTGLCAGSRTLRLRPHPGSRRRDTGRKWGGWGPSLGRPSFPLSILSCRKDPCSVPAEWPGLWGSIPLPAVGLLPHCFSFGFSALPLSVAPTPFFQIPSLNSFKYQGWLLFSCWDPEKSHLPSLFPGLHWRLNCPYCPWLLRLTAPAPRPLTHPHVHRELSAPLTQVHTPSPLNSLLLTH